MRDRVVVIHPGSLGDVLLAVSAIGRLRARYPQCELVLIARPSVCRFLWDCQEIDHWISIEDQDSAELFSRRSHISARVQVWFRQCQLVVAWLEDKEGVLSDALAQCGVREKRIVSPFSSTLRQPHQSDRFLESIDEISLPSEANHTLQISKDVVVQARAYLKDRVVIREQPLVIIHPGSGSRQKCVKPEWMASFVQRLQHTGLSPLIVEGPADQEIVERMGASIGVSPIVLRELDLSLLAGILTQADLYIGHDSGVTHLAASLGVKTLTIFGPTDHRRWAPLGSHVTVIQGHLCACHSWESVRQCVDQVCLEIPLERVLSLVGAHLQSLNDYNPL